MNKEIGIKLADGSFYPIINDNPSQSKDIRLTTVTDDQTKVQINLYKSDADNITDDDYVGTLTIDGLSPQEKGEANLRLSVKIDDDGNLFAEVTDELTGKSSSLEVSLGDSDKEDPTGEDYSKFGTAVAAGVLGAAVGAAFSNGENKTENSETKMADEKTEEMNLDEYNDMDSLMIEGSDSAVINDDANNLEEGTVMEDMDDFKLPEDDSKTETDDFPSLDDDMKMDDDLNLDTDLNLDDDISFDEPTLADTSDASDSIEGTDSKETDSNFDFDDKSFEEEKTQSSYSSSPLYDEDTFDETAKDKKKKVLIPVVICGVVVVLALAALLVYLFAIKPKSQAKEQAPVKVEVVETENSDAAREDEIIIVETPVVEPVNKNSEKSANSEVISYKIKWGDTLWDISKTYYKTPWQYQFLADYNNIQNPDLIIAGKNLDIPPK